MTTVQKNTQSKQKPHTSRRMGLRNMLAGLFVLAGLLVIAFPFLKERREDEQQQNLLAMYEQAFRQLEDGELSGQTDASEGGTEAEAAQDARQEAELAALDASLVLGILQIDAIDLKQPILKDATPEHLNLSVATIEPTTAPGQEGNFVVAGHHSRTYGRHFNRLEELKRGDIVRVQMQTQEYSYEITDCFIVSADETQVLLPDAHKSEITLITCHYPREGETQRFVARGRLVE